MDRKSFIKAMLGIGAVGGIATVATIHPDKLLQYKHKGYFSYTYSPGYSKEYVHGLARHIYDNVANVIKVETLLHPNDLSMTCRGVYGYNDEKEECRTLKLVFDCTKSYDREVMQSRFESS